MTRCKQGCAVAVTVLLALPAPLYAGKFSNPFKTSTTNKPARNPAPGRGEGGKEEKSPTSLEALGSTGKQESALGLAARSHSSEGREEAKPPPAEAAKNEAKPSVAEPSAEHQASKPGSVTAAAVRLKQMSKQARQAARAARAAASKQRAAEAEATVVSALSERLKTANVPCEFEFEVMSAGSQAREEPEKSSDFDIFFVLPEGISEETKKEAMSELNRVVRDVGATLKEGPTELKLELEGSGKPSDIVKLDVNFATMRTFKPIYPPGKSTLASATRQALGGSSALMAEGISSLHAEVTNALRPIEGLEGPQVKTNLYRPLQIFINLLALKHGLESTNSLDRIEELRGKLGKKADTKFLDRLQEAWEQVLDLRAAAAESAGEHQPGDQTVDKNEVGDVLKVLREIQRQEKQPLRLAEKRGLFSFLR